MSLGVEEGGLEMTEADAEAREMEARRGGGKGSGGARRAGNLSKMSGAGGMRYLEYGAAEKTKYTAKSSAMAKKLGLTNK